MLSLRPRLGGGTGMARGGDRDEERAASQPATRRKEAEVEVGQARAQGRVRFAIEERLLEMVLSQQRETKRAG